MRFPIAVVLSLAVASAAKDNGRIIGGSLTTIYDYPDMVALLRGSVFYHQDCGGVILNNRAVLSAAHCVGAWGIHARRIRVGSSYANNGGTVITTERLIVHPEYNVPTGHNNDIGILWTTEEIPVTAASRPAWIAGPNYHVADDQEVWAAGWGRTIANDGGSVSEQLQHVKIWTVNQETCRLRYLQRSPIPNFITENMLCAGWIDVGGRDQCQGDSGGPLYHNGVVVGITSWGEGCADPFFPGVNVRVSQYTSWIDSNR